jgi:hypothetical protein
MGKKFDFATTLTETQSYIGEAALPYVTAAFLKNRTADSGVKIVEDIIKYAYVAKLTASNVVQKGDHCNFTPAGTITAGEVKLEPCPMWIDLELCYKDLEALWNGLNNGNMNTQEAGADFNQALQGVLINAMNIEFEKSIWAQTTTGTTGTTSCASFSGIPEQITNKVTGATLTASNIVAAVDALVAALPQNILQDLAAVKIYMNPKNALYYKQALMKLGLNTPADMQPQTYAGMPIVAIIGMDDKLMVAIQPQNIALGVSAMDNFSQLIIKDMRESTLDNKVRMKLQGKVDVKVIYPAEAAKYA